MMLRLWTIGFCILWPSLVQAQIPFNSYDRQVLRDGAVAYWTFDAKPSQNPTASLVGEKLTGRSAGQLRFASGSNGSSSPVASTPALQITNPSHRLQVTDPGDDSVLDFTAGDEITLEAWVNPTAITEGQQVYVVGKGRTHRKGFSQDNQNYALRLRSINGQAHISFLFRLAADPKGAGGSYCRWNSDLGFLPKTGWHHVALCYRFGDKADPVAYIDGEKSGGTWDMGGPTLRPPVVDNDELWIGSSMNGNPSSTFRGTLDSIAIYRNILTEEQIRRRVPMPRPPAPPLPELAPPTKKVLVEIFENVPNTSQWNFQLGTPSEHYFTTSFAFLQLPHRYSPQGVQIDRANPLVIRASSRFRLPRGKLRVLLRARHGARLFIDDKEILTSPFHKIANSGHGEIRDVVRVKDRPIRELQTGDNEQFVDLDSDGKQHTWRLEVFIGGGKKRPELGETSVSFAKGPYPFRIISPQPYLQSALTEDGWAKFVAQDRIFLRELNSQRRRLAARDELRYWQQRHEYIRNALATEKTKQPEPLPDGLPQYNPIDISIGHRLHQTNTQPTPLTDDFAFLKRITLDTTGRVPTLQEIRDFQADRSPQRRSNVIDRLLADPAWADHQVGYWQDQLAENPNLVNPTLNNTGPFRWWIYESFLENKPFDQFATELIRMQGSTYYGGPGGFALATGNDAPMAAKAHIISQAFLGVNLKCARCHDAPFHEVTQEDLFSLAALLNRSPQAVPKTSTVPVADAEEAKSLLVKISLKPGEKVAPKWPFPELNEADSLTAGIRKLRSREPDTREQLALLITSPENERFAQVIVNRLWKRYLGRGLIEPVDDWEHKTPSHPELMTYLARELMLNGYDLKHVSRLIFNSHVYQRVAVSEKAITEKQASLFAGPLRRRMTAEQVVDSLFTASGKPFHAGVLNIDADGSRNFNQSLNLGRPVRAWEFISLSNERDRPSLALPLAQPFVTLMESFGWQSSRQSPISERDEEPTVLQPAILSNGVLARRFTRVSEDSAFTKLALQKQPLSELIEQITLQALSRKPTAAEQQLFTEFLQDGYETRLVAEVDPKTVQVFRAYSTGVSWSNHLDPAATEVQQELEKRVEAGDPPTPRLQPDWRERMEDVLWTLLNTPEFVFVP